MWSATLNGHTVGDGSDWLILADVELWGGWEVRSMVTTRPGRDGLVSTGRDRTGGRTVLLPVRYHAATSAEVLAALDALLDAWAPGDVVPLTLGTPAGTRTLFGKAGKPIVDHSLLPRAVRVGLSFDLVDPLAYSSPGYAFAEMGVMSGGLGWPAGWPWQWGTVTSGVSPWTNAGSVPSERWSVIAVARTPGATDPRFTCADGQVSLPGLSLAAGETLWLDGYARSAVVTPSVALVDSGRDVSWLIDRRFGDAWFAVPPGEHELRWSGGGDAVALVSLQSAWRV